MGRVSQLPARTDEDPIVTAETVEKVVVGGDLSKLTAEQRLEYVQGVCTSLGLNPLTQPFEYITLSGKLRLYAKRDATDQLRRLHGVSVEITGREKLGDVWCVTARATTPSGRSDEAVGAVPVAGLKSETLANALMKAETKAKRRVTLSICGLGILDETEVDIPAGSPPQRVPSAGPPSGPPVDAEDIAALADRIHMLPEDRQDELREVARRVGATGHTWTVDQYGALEQAVTDIEGELDETFEGES